MKPSFPKVSDFCIPKQGQAEGAGLVQPEEKAERGPYKCL